MEDEASVSADQCRFNDPGLMAIPRSEVDYRRDCYGWYEVTAEHVELLHEAAAVAIEGDLETGTELWQRAKQLIAPLVPTYRVGTRYRVEFTSFVHKGYRSVHDAVYWTINPVSAALLSRKQKNEMSIYSTASRDETRRIWLPIDIDPVRPSGISASAEERESARKVANSVLNELDRHGVTDDMLLLASSGNGFHILIRIDLPNDPASTELISRFLGACGNRFHSSSDSCLRSSMEYAWRRAGSGWDVQLCDVGAACASGSSAA